MKFSTRTTYGLRAMIYLASRENKENISIAEIAREENISGGYLEKLFKELKKNNLVKSVKGAQGGYSLFGEAKDISLYDVVKVLEGNLSLFECVSEEGKLLCDGKEPCNVPRVLIKVQHAINKTLKSMTLSDLL